MFSRLRFKFKRDSFDTIRKMNIVRCFFVWGLALGAIIVSANDVQNATLPTHERSFYKGIYCFPLLFDILPSIYIENQGIDDGGNSSSSNGEHSMIKNETCSSSQPKKKKGDSFYPIIIQAARRYQVDPALIQAIIMAESSYNPKAVSKSGARGLMQLMPRTAKSLGVKDSFHPEHNINGGVKYFKQLLNRFDHNVTLALAAYNAGARKVRKYKGIPPFRATQYYIKKVSQYYLHYKKEMNEEMVKNMDGVGVSRRAG
ncbi:MAG: lytic transglycosylase domain-containing protein [Thermodesulfobacteriota bacterium]|nr:lytic transglycosylase domain-containing protein [Thermodesulfobacteriota bacterium]